jgi:Glycosyltransferase (GlcNAc)
MTKIYVQIPAYRDQELSKTLLDLYAKSSNPRNLRVGVVWQRAADERLDDAVSALPNLELFEVPYHKSQGCNWARNLLQQRWNGEQYTMLIDSHQRFIPNWDKAVIEMYLQLRKAGHRKPLLTAYLPAYDPLREPGGRKKRPYKIYPLARDGGILTKLTSYPIPFWRSLSQPIAADFLSLHFAFTSGEFNQEVAFDPEIYFFGDEVLTSARAFTAGYDLFHPHQIVGWHCYDRSSRVPHWDDHALWGNQHCQSLKKIETVFAGRYRGRHGLGSARTLAEYEDRILVKLIDR